MNKLDRLLELENEIAFLTTMDKDISKYSQEYNSLKSEIQALIEDGKRFRKLIEDGEAFIKFLLEKHGVK